MFSTKRRFAATIAGFALAATTLTACGTDDDSDSASDGGDGKGGTVTLGIIGSWTDGLSTAYLWKNVLEDEGYDVEIKDVSDAAPLYTGLSKGDVDVYPSAWPEVTHKAYMDQYGDDLEDLGTYYDNAKLTIAVPEYTDIDSIEDLKGKGSQFGDRIVGIEPGAGLTKATKDNVIPEYGLEDEYELVTSSTTAMLTELEKATDAKEDIVVTLWRPFWANAKFPVKDLEDPKGALGEAEGLHEIANKDFAEENPEVAEMMGNLSMDDETYGEMEDLVVNKYGKGKEEEAIDEFLDNHPEVIEQIKGEG